MSRGREHTWQAQRRMGVKDTRTPVATVFENLQDMSVDELVEEFGVTREQVEAVLEFVAHSLETPAPAPTFSCDT